MRNENYTMFRNRPSGSYSHPSRNLATLVGTLCVSCSKTSTVMNKKMNNNFMLSNNEIMSDSGVIWQCWAFNSSSLVRDEHILLLYYIITMKTIGLDVRKFKQWQILTYMGMLCCLTRMHFVKKRIAPTRIVIKLYKIIVLINIFIFTQSIKLFVILVM